MSKEVDKDYEPTMSMDIKNLQIKVNDKIIQIQIWDSCGSDKFPQSAPNLFKNAFRAILSYAANDKKPFEDLNNWYNILSDYSYDNIVFLIENKFDLKEERIVTIEDAETFKNQYDDIN